MSSFSNAAVGDGDVEALPNCGFAAVRISRNIVEKMDLELRAQTAECVMDTFGISVNTWVKIKRGEPIRRSVGHRLVARLKCNRL